MIEEFKQSCLKRIQEHTPIENIKEGSKVFKDLGLDSLDRLDVIIDVENDNGVGITDEKYKPYG